MAWNGNAEKVLSAALAVERAGPRPWAAADLIAFLDGEEGDAKPSDATIYRVLNRLDEQLGFLTSVTEEIDEARAPGRPRKLYALTPAGLAAATSAANWLSVGGIGWARVIVSGL